MAAVSLAEFELLVMLAALALGPEEAYTVSIVDHIQGKTGRTVRRANVYTALRRLEEKGLVATRMGEPRSERGGRPPRLVAVRPAGVAAVRKATDAIQSLAADLGDVLGDVLGATR